MKGRSGDSVIATGRTKTIHLVEERNKEKKNEKGLLYIKSEKNLVFFILKGGETGKKGGGGGEGEQKGRGKSDRGETQEGPKRVQGGGEDERIRGKRIVKNSLHPRLGNTEKNGKGRGERG